MNKSTKVCGKYLKNNMYYSELAKTKDINKFMYKHYADIILRDNKTRLCIYSYCVGKIDEKIDNPDDINKIRRTIEDKLKRYLSDVETKKEVQYTSIPIEEIYVNGKWVTHKTDHENEEDEREYHELEKKAVGTRKTQVTETYYLAEKPFRKFTGKYENTLK